MLAVSLAVVIYGIQIARQSRKTGMQPED
jgi:hypothetical protein